MLIAKNFNVPQLILEELEAKSEVDQVNNMGKTKIIHNRHENVNIRLKDLQKISGSTIILNKNRLLHQCVMLG